ncbi:MAG: hypothetical protein R3E31_10585 [Chloroflexota bacterium]
MYFVNGSGASSAVEQVDVLGDDAADTAVTLQTSQTNVRRWGGR